MINDHCVKVKRSRWSLKAVFDVTDVFFKEEGIRGSGPQLLGHHRRGEKSYWEAHNFKVLFETRFRYFFSGAVGWGFLCMPLYRLNSTSVSNPVDTLPGLFCHLQSQGGNYNNILTGGFDQGGSPFTVWPCGSLGAPIPIQNQIVRHLHVADVKAVEDGRMGYRFVIANVSQYI